MYNYAHDNTLSHEYEDIVLYVYRIERELKDILLFNAVNASSMTANLVNCQSIILCNIGKENLTFYIVNVVVEAQNEVNAIGVTTDSKLKFNYYMSEL